MEDLMGNAFDAMWSDLKPKPRPKIKTYDASRGSQYVQNVRPVNYRPQVKRGLSKAEAYALARRQAIARQRTNKLIGKAFKGLVKTSADIGRTGAVKAKAGIKSTEAYQRLEVKREKDKLWKQYKAEKQAEAKKAEIDAYKKKLFGK